MARSRGEKSVWAIERGRSSLKALRLACAEGSTALEPRDRMIVEWPSGDGDDGQKRLEAFLARDDVRTSPLAIALPADDGLIETIKVPPVRPELLEKAAQFEVSKRLPVALDQLAWDLHLLEDVSKRRDGPEPHEGVLIAARREAVDALLRPYLEAGVSIVLCQLSSVALVNALSWEQPGRAGVVVDVGTARTVIVVTDGRRLWQRVVPFGGDRFTADLAEHAKLAWPKAETLKRNPMKIAEPLAIARALRPAYEELAGEVDRTVRRVRTHGVELGEPRVRLLGNGSKAFGLEAYLKQQLGMELEPGSETWGGSEGPLSGDTRLAVPLGLAVQVLGIGRIRANLRPPDAQGGWLRGGVLGRLFRSRNA